jgi:hypothetical protein
MSHLPLWYLGKLDSDTCNQAIAELSGIEVRDAAMGIDGAEKNHSTRNTSVRFAQPDFWLAKDFVSFAGTEDAPLRNVSLITSRTKRVQLDKLYVRYYSKRSACDVV